MRFNWLNAQYERCSFYPSLLALVCLGSGGSRDKVKALITKKHVSVCVYVGGGVCVCSFDVIPVTNNFAVSLRKLIEMI